MNPGSGLINNQSSDANRKTARRRPKEFEEGKDCLYTANSARRDIQVEVKR